MYRAEPFFKGSFQYEDFVVFIAKLLLFCFMCSPYVHIKADN